MRRAQSGGGKDRVKNSPKDSLEDAEKGGAQTSAGR